MSKKTATDDVTLVDNFPVAEEWPESGLRMYERPGPTQWTRVQYFKRVHPEPEHAQFACDVQALRDRLILEIVRGSSRY
jgi:hypothetical protein